MLQRRRRPTSHQCPSLPHDVAVAAILNRRVPRRHISAVQGSGRRKLPSSRAAAMELMVARAGVQAAPARRQLDWLEGWRRRRQRQRRWWWLKGDESEPV